MLNETFNSIINAARNVFANRRTTGLIALVYAALLGSLYLFMATREASLAQVVFTFGLALAAVVLFFLLHAMIASSAARAGDDKAPSTAGSLIKQSIANSWKLIVITLPIIALGILIAYLLGRAKNYLGAGSTSELFESALGSRSRKPASPIDWRVAILSSIRYLAFGLALPLATIHLWLAVAREGLGSTIKRVGSHLAKAFAPQSVLVYVAGFLVFGLLPYWLLFRTTPNSRAWLEISFLVTRLVAVFALTLFGWVITVWALSLLSNQPAHLAETSTGSTVSSPHEPASEAV